MRLTDQQRIVIDAKRNEEALLVELLGPRTVLSQFHGLSRHGRKHLCPPTTANLVRERRGR